MIIIIIIIIINYENNNNNRTNIQSLKETFYSMSEGILYSRAKTTGINGKYKDYGKEQLKHELRELKKKQNKDVSICFISKLLCN